MIRVGFRPIHSVKIGPYCFDHFWNWIQGCDLGMSNLFPMNGMGVGPGGSRSHWKMSWISITSGITMRDTRTRMRAREPPQEIKFSNAILQWLQLNV